MGGVGIDCIYTGKNWEWSPDRRLDSIKYKTGLPPVLSRFMLYLEARLI